MNIRTNSTEKSQQLIEKEVVIPQQKVQKQSVNAIGLMINKHLQFETEQGVIMGNMSSGIKQMIGLQFHRDRTSDFDGFIESIKIFVSASGSLLTVKDISRLKIEYKK